jgi:glucose/arabinose dehydrogenase
MKDIMLLKVDFRRRAVLFFVCVLLLLSACAFSPSDASLVIDQQVDPCSIRTPSPTVPKIELVRVINGLSRPVHLTHADDNSGRLFLVEQPGRILIFQNGTLLPTPFLDIRNRVSFGGERGLLSVAFHPKYASNGRFFVNYTRSDNGLKTFISEFRVSKENPNVADPTERVVLAIDQPFNNHNGGLNKFGPDGFLYIGMGDGGAAGDPQDNGQRLDTLLGKLLRIDIDKTNNGLAYAVPPDNPFVGRANVKSEIWAYGLRNPWRYSFDRCTGRLYLGDVGQNKYEEINLIERGKNYGWRMMEGAHCFNPSDDCNRAGFELPIAEYDHSSGCSVTGGYVYRGKHFPGLQGRYFFGDYCGGQMWALSQDENGAWKMTILSAANFSISSFGEDQEGELYLLDYNGSVYRLAAK